MKLRAVAAEAFAPLGALDDRVRRMLDISFAVSAGLVIGAFVALMLALGAFAFSAGLPVDIGVASSRQQSVAADVAMEPEDAAR